MRSSGIIPSIVLVTVLCGAIVPILGQVTNQPGSRHGQSMPRHQGFFDYALGKINPRDKNYGASMEKARDSLVEYTIDDLYFSSNVMTLVLLSGLVTIVFLQWRAMDKRELIAASLITQL